MKRTVYRLPVWLLITAMLLGTLSGCGKKNDYEAPAFSMPQEFSAVEGGQVAENSRFTLLWNAERTCVQLQDKQTQKIWSTTPYEFCQSEDSSSIIESPVYIEYQDEEDGNTRTQRAYSQVIEEETVAVRRVENGIVMELYFGESEIMVPVTYTLRDNGLAISIDTEAIQENANKLLSISLAPFFCAAPNEGKDNYLVIPNGSGALMYSTETVGEERSYTGEVYGKDGTRQVVYEPSEETPLTLPMFGAKYGADALCAVIEEGTGMAFISATAGDPTTSYSNVYAKFQMRSYDIVEASVNWNTTEMKMYADDLTVNSDICVMYYPLSGDDADYLGMANTYRRYLQRQGLLQEKKTAAATYGVTYSGGALTYKDLFGIPYTSLKVATTYEQMQTSLGNLYEQIGSLPTVNMVGFGESGLDAEKVGGGFTLSREYGTDAQLDALLQYVADKSGDLYLDMDLIHFTKSADGFSTITDKAQSANREAAKLPTLSKSLHSPLEDGRITYVLSRTKLGDAFDKALALVQKKSLPGIGLSTLGNTPYSDYQDAAYAGRGNTESQVTALLNKAKEADLPISLVTANGYAAALADVVFDAPIAAGDYDAFDEEVPLYAAVFKGYVDLVSAPINLAELPETAYLEAIENGTALGFSLIGNYDVALADTPHEQFYGSHSADNEARISALVQESQAYYKAIADAAMTDHRILENGVTETTFDNGVVVYTNSTDAALETPLGTLAAGEFRYAEKGEEP